MERTPRRCKREMARVESEIRFFSHNAMPQFANGAGPCSERFPPPARPQHEAASSLGGSPVRHRGVGPSDAAQIARRAPERPRRGGGRGVTVVANDDRVPTCMENRGMRKVGEDLVHVYDSPASTDHDPSGWILTFFSLFFAMIISDAGYGLVFLLLALYLKWKFPRLAGAGRRFVKMSLLLSLCCIGWGALVSSYFGIELNPNNPLRKWSLLHTFFREKKPKVPHGRKRRCLRGWSKDLSIPFRGARGQEFLVAAS